jgi:hypothetical protein
MSLKLTISTLFIALVLITACKKKDTSLPVITISGQPVIVIPLNSPYTDAGATATDDFDGDLSVTTTGTVDTNFAGTYYIIYKATDAAGNEAKSSRAVIVRNEADIYNGNYNTRTIIGSDTTYFTATSTISNVLNHRIWLVGYSNISTATVYADLHHDTLIIQHQLTNAGLPLQIHAFTGNGFVKTINDHTVFEISFTDSVAGNIYMGTSVYTKTN